MRSFLNTVILSLICLLFAACSTEQVSSVPLEFDLLTERLDAFVEHPNERLGFEANGLSVQALDDLELTLSTTVSSPVWKGQTLQATSVALTGHYAVVSYNTKGAVYSGALDVIDLSNKLKPVLTTRLIYPSVDVNAVSVHADKVYAVLATESEKIDYTALLQVLPLTDGKLELRGSKGMSIVGLKGFAGTSVSVDDAILVTSGDNAGLNVFDIDNLNSSSFVALEDARWVDQEGRYRVVLQGTPGKLSIFEEGNLSHELSIDGLDEAEAKSSVTIVGTTAFVSAGSKGIMLVDLSSGAIISTLSFDTNFVTNAVTADSNFVFIAGADKGIYAAYAQHTFQQPRQEKLELHALGKLALSDFDSANHVALDGSTLVVAAGLGGVRIIELGLRPLALESVAACEWRVSNPNAFPVSFQWNALEGDASSYLLVEANAETSFKAANVQGALEILVNAQQVAKTDSAFSCAEPSVGEAEFRIVRDWFNNNGRQYGFQAAIRVTNTTDKPVTDWQVSFETDAKLGNVWNASKKAKNTFVTLKALSWNRTIQPGESVYIGMHGTAKEAFKSVENLKVSLDF